MNNAFLEKFKNIIETTDLPHVDSLEGRDMIIESQDHIKNQTFLEKIKFFFKSEET